MYIFIYIYIPICNDIDTYKYIYIYMDILIYSDILWMNMGDFGASPILGNLHVAPQMNCLILYSLLH